MVPIAPPLVARAGGCLALPDPAAAGIAAPHHDTARLVARQHIARRVAIAAAVAGDQPDRVRSPIGLEIGAETPEQIAVSILAEITALA